ncbi:MAG: hypothetical protein IJ111_02135 [Eggerthellaceae bacterium]|nr:hypothetical protein [Eggerthellaceae bacterium]
MTTVQVDSDLLVRKPPLLDETGHIIATELAKQTLLMEKSLNTSITRISDWIEVADLVKEGLAPEVFPLGTVLHTPWTDVRASSSTEWDFLWRVVAHGSATLRDGSTVPAMYLQSSLCLPFSFPFDEREAFYAAKDGLAAGTYHINSGAGYQQMAANTDYQFTIAAEVPAGGQLMFKSSTYSTAPAVVNVYHSAGASAAAEECAVTVGSEGTSLGTLATEPTDYVNNIHRHVLGSNRWSQSAARQFLNSTAAPGSWWAAQNGFDRPSAIAATSAGFLSGFAEDFVEALQPVLVKTALPYCDGGTSGGTQADETWDRVFLPSAEQLYWVCTWLGIPYSLEGDAWDYWKRVYGGASPATMGATHKEFCLGSMGAESTMRYVFERSAYRSYGSDVAYCYSTGNLNANYASYGYFCAPACCIC